MQPLRVEEFLGVISLNQDVCIYDINGNTLYEGGNSTVPSRLFELYINSAWVADGTSELTIEVDYDVYENEEEED